MLWQLGMWLPAWNKLTYLWKYLEHRRSETQTVFHTEEACPGFQMKHTILKMGCECENVRKWQFLTYTLITVDLKKYQQYIAMTEKATAKEEWGGTVPRVPLPPHQLGRNLFENRKQAQLLRRGWFSCASRLRRYQWQQEEAEEGVVIVQN